MLISQSLVTASLNQTFSVTVDPVSDFVTFGILSASLDIHDNDSKSIHILLLDPKFSQFMLIP